MSASAGLNGQYKITPVFGVLHDIWLVNIVLLREDVLLISFPVLSELSMYNGPVFTNNYLSWNSHLNSKYMDLQYWYIDILN